MRAGEMKESEWYCKPKRNECQWRAAWTAAEREVTRYPVLRKHLVFFWVRLLTRSYCHRCMMLPVSILHSFFLLSSSFRLAFFADCPLNLQDLEGY